MLNHPIELSIFLFFLALLPLIVVVSTSFLKFSITLSLLRNALGLQQVPSNLVIYGLSLILMAYTMAPVIGKITSAVSEKKIHIEDKNLYAEVKERVLGPYTEFLKRNTSPREISFFESVGKRIWHKPESEIPSKDSLVTLIPAFTLTQLSESFKVGLLINLPFIAIDLIVSNLLLALGMMMVSPVTISMPFKLLVFIMIGGWDLLIKQLLLSFQ